MNEDFYKKVLEDASIGYAYHRIICDEAGDPCDYKFIDINKSFEKLTGLKKDNVIDNTIVAIMPDIRKGEFDWVSFYGEVALGGGNKEFEQYSAQLGKYYHVKVFSPEKYFFITVFTDITAQRNLVDISKEFIENSMEEIDYQSISNNMLKLSGAKYVAFNLFDDNGRDFTTVGLSGIQKSISKAIKMLGFNVNGKKWNYDPIREMKTRGKCITCFENLHDLTGDIISENISNLLQKTFRTGKIALVKIRKDEVVLGDFTLIMKEGVELSNRETLEVYASQVGLFLEKKKAERKLQASQNRLELAMDAGEHGFWDWDLDTDVIYFSPGYYTMLGYKPDELPMSKETWLNLMHPDDQKKVVSRIEYNVKKAKHYEEEFRLKCKDGTWKWISGRAKSYKINREGTPTRVVGVHIDISKMKEIQEILANERRRLENIIEATNVGTWEWNVQTGETIFNERWAEIIGYTLEELSPVSIQTWITHSNPFDLAKSEELLKEVFEGKRTHYAIDCRMKHKEGHSVWVHDRGKVISWTIDGQPLLMAGTHTDITRRKQMEQSLVEQNNLLEGIINGVPDVLAIQRPDHTIERYNDAGYKMLNMTRDKVTEKKCYELIGRDRECEVCATRTALQTKKLEGLEKYVPEMGIFLECRSIPVCDQDGNIIWIVEQMRDITTRKQMETQLQEGNDRFDQLAEQSRTVTWEVDKDGVITYISHVAQDVFGYRPEELIGCKHFFDLHPLEGNKDFKDSAFEMFRNKHAFENFENKIQTKDGQIIWVSTNAMPILDEDGKLLGYRGADRDITDKKNFEIKLEESEKNFRTFFTSIDDLIFVGDKQGRIYYTNNSVTKKLGYTNEELSGMNILDVHPKEYRQEAGQIFGDMFLGKRDTCPLPLIKKDGSYLPVDTRTCFGEWNGEECIFGISKDLSTEQEALQKFNKLFDNNPALMAVSTIPDRVFTDVNTAFAEKLGYSKEEIIGKKVTDLKLFVDGKMQTDVAKELQDTGTIRNIELKVRAKDGSIIDGLFSGEIIESQGKSYFLTVMKDISEIKRAERMLAERDQVLSKLSHNVPGAIYQYLMSPDGTSCFPFASQGIYEIYEVTAEEVKIDARKVFTRIHPNDYDRVVANIKDSYDNLTIWEDEYRVILPQKGPIWVRGIARPEKLFDDSVLWHGYLRDVSEIKKTEERLHESEDRYRYEREQFKTTLLSVGDGVISTDCSGKIRIMNRIAEELTGWTQEEANGKAFEIVFNIIHEYTREVCINPVKEVLETGSIVDLANHTILISRDGREVPIEDSAAPIKDKDGKTTGVVVVFRDFTEKRLKQQQVEYLSFHDQLTGLYNRRYFENELKRIDTSRNLPISLVMLDVNGLKLTNDAFGHSTGDELLAKVADTMKQCCRAEEIISRVGGDEFIILLSKTEEKYALSLIGRIKQAFIEEKVAGIQISVSAGVGTKVHQCDDIHETMKIAEDCMYRDKISDRTSQRHKAINMILKTLNEKIPREERHSSRVSKICELIGSAMNLRQADINELVTTATLHDIGKIAISNDILNKKECLSNSEWLEIRRHPEVSYNILSSVNDYAHLAEIVLTHHERWDGKGYPKGLKGKDIPLQARIIAVADAYDAMTEARPYRKAMGKFEAFKELKDNAGTQFDPQIVEIFVNNFHMNNSQ